MSAVPDQRELVGAFKKNALCMQMRKAFFYCVAVCTGMLQTWKAVAVLCCCFGGDVGSLLCADAVTAHAFGGVELHVSPFDGMG